MVNLVEITLQKDMNSYYMKLISLKEDAKIYQKKNLVHYYNMKQALLFIFLLSFFTPSNAQLSENFSDGDLTSNPTWQGDLNDFITNANEELQLNSSGSDTSILFTAVEMPDTIIWEFEFNLDFAPSNNNRMRIYLQSNTANYPDVEGYYVEVGQTGSEDALRLFRTDGGNSTELAAAMSGALGSQPAMAKVKITRNQDGEWAIFTSYDGSDVLNLEANAVDDTYLGGSWFFGIWCKYTSTNAEKFFFDDIIISSLVPDVTPPQIVSVIPTSVNTLEVNFDEPIDSTTAVDLGNYFVNNSIGSPQSATWSANNQATVNLTYNNTFTNLTNYLLDVQNVEDQVGIPLIAASVPFQLMFDELELVNVIAINESELEIEFNKPIENITGSLTTNYSIDQGVGTPLQVTVDVVEPFRVFLELGQNLANGQTYNLQVENIKDLDGLTIATQSLPFDFLIGVEIEPGDLVINEILFNPTTGGNDFVELYNNSDKFLNISDLIISNTTRTTGRDKDVEVSHIMKPREYVAITSGRDFILNNYTVQDSDVLFENSLPLFNDANGNVSISTQYNMDTVVIDAFDYDVDFHYPFLDDKEGTSLERISFDALTQSRSNWHSASTLAGGATPTYQNSQLRPTNPADEIFNLADNVFSPDEDGFKDFLLIDYSLENPGYVINLNIYDAKGRLIRTLFRNELLAVEGTLKWDGLTDDGGRARIGIYVILAEIFTPDGDVMEFKKTCVVAANLE